MANCAVVDSNDIVVNIIVADVGDIPPEGCSLIPLYLADIGYTWTGSEFVPPPIVVEGETIIQIDEAANGG